MTRENKPSRRTKTANSNRAKSSSKPHSNRAARKNSGKKRINEADYPPHIALQIKKIKQKLEQIREYKKLLSADDMVPDVADKALESKLIVQLLRIEKGLPAKKKPPIRKSAKNKNKRK